MADKNKVFYGEYSLKHWIDLILTKNIILPEYQRSFVWDKEQVIKLHETFQNDLFIPPVTIGCHSKNNETNNLIIDGQQRLTSILLMYLDVYPNKDSLNQINLDSFTHENDDEIKDEKNINKPLKWTFRNITKLGNTQNIISNKLKSELKLKRYDKLNLSLSSGFFFRKVLRVFIYYS